MPQIDFLRHPPKPLLTIDTEIRSKHLPTSRSSPVANRGLHERADKVYGPAALAHDDALDKGRVPLVNVALHKDDFGLWVGVGELAPEEVGADVCGGAVGAQEPVPVFAREGLAFAVEFGIGWGGVLERGMDAPLLVYVFDVDRQSTHRPSPTARRRPGG